MEKYSKLLRWLFVSIFLLFILVINGCLIVNWIATRYFGLEAESDEATITNFRICDSEDETHCANEFANQYDSLFACGIMHTESYAKVSILLFNDKQETPIYKSKVGDRFQNGDFCREILLPISNRSGRYRVNVYLFRNVIATSEFEIK